MSVLLQISFAVLLLVLGWYAVPTFVTGVVSFLIASVIGVFALLFLAYFKESVSEDERPPVVGSVLSLLIQFNHLYDYLSDLAKKHKTFRFVGPHHSEVFTADPVNVEHLLRTNFANYGKGKNHNMILSDLFGDGIFAVDGEKWQHQRKLASHEFSTKNLRDFSTAVFRSNAAKLASKIQAEGNGEKVVDLQDLFLRSTLDAIFTVGFGFELSSLSGSDEFGTRFTKAFDDSNFITYKRYVDLFWKAKRYLNIGLESCLKKNIKVIDDFVYKLIRCKREQMTADRIKKIQSGREDMLSRFLVESQKDPAKMTDKYLRDITLNFIIAGRDSSANTLTWLFYMLCKHPQVRDKVVKNVQEATDTEDSKLSFDEFCDKITEEALNKMHYLHAAITETMRLYPAVPLDGKCAEADDILPDGLVIKKGDNLSYMPYPMGRMEYIWGENAEEYFPERWIENGMFHPQSPFKFTAFQAGPRVCLGKEFAYRQIKILSAVLLYFFKFDLTDEHRQVTYQTMFTLHMHQGLPVLVNPAFSTA